MASIPSYSAKREKERRVQQRVEHANGRQRIDCREEYSVYSCVVTVHEDNCDIRRESTEAIALPFL